MTVFAFNNLNPAAGASVKVRGLIQYSTTNDGCRRPLTGGVVANNLGTLTDSPHHISKLKLNLNPVKIYINVVEDKKTIYKELKNKAGVYLWHNNITGDQYIGSSRNIYKRLADYFKASNLAKHRNSYILNAISKYGIEIFSFIIIQIVGDTESVTKKQCLQIEQKYIAEFNPKYNIYKYILAEQLPNGEYKQGKYVYTEETRANLKGEKNSFFGRKHTEETKKAQSALKLKENNPMYGKPKSPEFMYHATKDRTGPNNPMYGKPKSPETIKKLSKAVYQYDAITKNLINSFTGVVIAKKTLKMGYDTLKKYINTGKIYQNKYIFSHKFPLSEG
jgi:group I intron endonuclease